ncbi:UNKNOWN [Stylonychia lemnae]|uniref:Uncharacterized protein n=1 Tax=Stylonychia lemnae TaxID=5949 RepID=A0A078AJX1_STYLE|nr:UNKNOWN [Stylonychia lemnae]|eukprot:CDW81103.1 UNKNOWN [Stylonychia lemnae]
MNQTSKLNQDISPFRSRNNLLNPHVSLRALAFLSSNRGGPNIICSTQSTTPRRQIKQLNNFVCTQNQIKTQLKKFETHQNLSKTKDIPLVNKGIQKHMLKMHNKTCNDEIFEEDHIGSSQIQSRSSSTSISSQPFASNRKEIDIDKVKIDTQMFYRNNENNEVILMPSKRYRQMDYFPHFMILDNQVIHSKIRDKSNDVDCANKRNKQRKLQKKFVRDQVSLLMYKDTKDMSTMEIEQFYNEQSTRKFETQIQQSPSLQASRSANLLIPCSLSKFKNNLTLLDDFSNYSDSSSSIDSVMPRDVQFKKQYRNQLRKQHQQRKAKEQAVLRQINMNQIVRSMTINKNQKSVNKLLKSQNSRRDSSTQDDFGKERCSSFIVDQFFPRKSSFVKIQQDKLKLNKEKLQIQQAIIPDHQKTQREKLRQKLDAQIVKITNDQKVKLKIFKIAADEAEIKKLKKEKLQAFQNKIQEIALKQKAFQGQRILNIVINQKKGENKSSKSQSEASNKNERRTVQIKIDMNKYKAPNIEQFLPKIL